MEDEGKKYWLSIAAFVLVFIAVVVTLSTFMQQTSNRIVAQANQYVSDATAQSCVLVSTLMENTQKDIETIAALASESADVTDIVTSEEWLISVEETSPFDTIDFVDVDGMQHSPQHEPVNVSDRSYFKRAMAGESGIEAVFNTRMTHENLVYFFAPVREGADGPVVGLLLAHYSENRLADLLSGDFFGYASQVMLCLPTGEVVAATDSSYVGRNLIQEAQADPSATSGARDLERAFANHETVTYSYKAERGTGSVCIREVPGLGWMMLETFPAAATEQMINEANEGGWNALFVIVVVFVLVIAGIIFYNNRRHRSLTRSMRDREDVQRGVAKLTERLVLMDLDADRFRYMSGPVTPSDPYELEGSYTAMIERLQGLVVGDEAKAEVAKLYDKHTIIDLMPPGSDEIRFEYQMNRGGDVKWEDINLICVQRDAAGMPTRLLYTTQDVTALKQREKQLQLAMEDSYRAAVAANNAKSDFLSRMSHDIRTPLNGIIGVLGVNEAHAEDAEYVSQNRKKARVAADHLLSLINDVLDMSKIEDSKVVLEHKPFNVIDVIDEVLVVGRLRAPEFGVTVESIGAEDLVHTDVIGSPDHVRRVLLNLVDNAVKYNRLGGTVRCAVDELGVKGNIVTYRFVVSDTGVGMSEEFLKRIFEPFTQAGSDARSNYQGTGMGMPIAKGFVEKMDGSIDVTSTQGEGSSFCVVLPFEIDHAPERHAGSADAEGECDVSGMRVLLAEDNDFNLEIATTLLADEGVAVTCAANGREAFDTFVDRPAGSFDAILMDIMMPVMDGYEAACAIRRSVKADVGSVPIFAMTANAFAEDAQRAHDAGMNGHLTKPIDMEKAKQALATARR